mgnify:CR=1 FL=1
MKGPFYFRNVGGPDYPASDGMVSVTLQRRGDELVIYTDGSPLAGVPFRSLLEWIEPRNLDDARDVYRHALQNELAGLGGKP